MPAPAKPPWAWADHFASSQPRGCSGNAQGFSSSAWSLPAHILPAPCQSCDCGLNSLYLSLLEWGPRWIFLTHLSSFALWSILCVFSGGEEWDPLALPRSFQEPCCPCYSDYSQWATSRWCVHIKAEKYVGIKWLSVGKAFCKVSEIVGAIINLNQHWLWESQVHLACRKHSSGAQETGEPAWPQLARSEVKEQGILTDYFLFHLQFVFYT